MFGEDVSGRFLERRLTTFKRKIIQQGRKLPSASDLEELLLAADTPEVCTEVNADFDELFKISFNLISTFHRVQTEAGLNDQNQK